ncbi:hypothetical protein EXS65_00025 [Candidatus Peribacteria bacterium]|nr:hypothetical protein [Candidatus Peribacteria bacterium]
MTQRTVVTLSSALFLIALLWGGYTLLVYLGIPIHALVYALPSDVDSIGVACGGQASIGTYLCRGSAFLAPFVIALFQMASPFWLYILLSLLTYGGFLLVNGYKTGFFELRLTMRPMYLVLAFAVSVWLIATTLSIGTFYNVNTPPEQMVADQEGQKILQPFRRFYEPLPQVYGGVGPQGMAELQANYQSLLSRGCLTMYGTTMNGAKIYDLHFLCMQSSFFSRVGLQLLMIFLFVLNLLVLGRFVLQKILRIRSVHPLLTLCFSIGLGALGWVSILWTLSIFGLLQTTIIRVLFFAMPIVLFTETIAWARASWNDTFSFDVEWKDVFPLLVWLLISYLALNFLNVIRPFPIGWDDLGSYLNRPRLLASYGSFIASMAQFQWEYLTSLGFMLFGYDSWNGSTFAMLINWASGLFAVLSVYVFGRLYFGRRRGVLAAMFYYFLPMTGHFSFADMKIDNAVFFVSTLSLLAAFVALFPPQQLRKENDQPSRSLLLVSGLLAGFAFAIKPTAVLSILMIQSVLAGALLGPIGFTGMTIVGFGILQYFGALNITRVAERALLGLSVSQSAVALSTLFVGVVVLAYALWKKKTLLRPFAFSLGAFVLGIGIASAAWMLHNGSIVGQFTPSKLLTAQDMTAPQVFYMQKEDIESMSFPPTVPIRFLPPDLKLDPDNPLCKTSARTEELDRYWGFGSGLKHYTTLPWRQVMNIDSFGYYVTLVPALLLLPLALLLPFFWSPERKWLRLLFAGTFVFLLQWIFVANGIAWYGIGMFLGFAMILEAFIVYAPDAPNRSLFSFLLTMSLIVCLVNRLWQFDTQKNIFEYPLGKVNATSLREITIPAYDDIRESVVSRHETLTDTPYTYRIGTFISYFIPQNREILPLADHQLMFFNCLNQERDHLLTLKRLKALGFNSIIFDTNTQTIEKDENGSLHKKVNAFLDFVNDARLGLNIVVNDPGNGIAYILLPTGTGAVQ